MPGAVLAGVVARGAGVGEVGVPVQAASISRLAKAKVGRFITIGSSHRRASPTTNRHLAHGALVSRRQLDTGGRVAERSQRFVRLNVRTHRIAIPRVYRRGAEPAALASATRPVDISRPAECRPIPHDEPPPTRIRRSIDRPAPWIVPVPEGAPVRDGRLGVVREPLAAQAAHQAVGLRRLAAAMVSVPLAVSLPGAIGAAHVAVPRA